jgi:HAD superfamily hydrolase (TIGR01509 family)
VTKAVIFDMDGVLTDSEPVINRAAILGLREFGVNAAPEDFIPFVGTGEDRYIGGVAEAHGVAYVPDMKKRVYEIYLQILPEMIRGFAGVHELVDRLRHHGVALAVASSADRIKVEANLAAIQLPLQSFAVVVAGEDVDRKKPAPDIYLYAASRLALAPGDCCVVEDAVHGVQAAKAAGMRCVAVEQSFPATTLQAAAPDCIRAGIRDITLPDLGIAEA